MLTRQYISEATAFDAGEEFTDADDVRAYFTRENLMRMFDECPYSDAELEDMASVVIDNRWHMESMCDTCGEAWTQTGMVMMHRCRVEFPKED